MTPKGRAPAAGRTGRPKGSGARQTREAPTRARILDAARALIRTGGFDSLSLEDIQLAAGVSTAVLARHFPDKNAILAELIDNRAPVADLRRGERDTKSEIVAAARRLFGEHGFHGISLDDLGAAVGITGPGVYRHFSNKEDVLAAALNSLLGDAAEQVWGSADGSTGATTLEESISRDADFVIQHASMVLLWQSEWRHLKQPALSHNVAIQRRYVQSFVTLLLDRRPELDRPVAEMMIVAALGLVIHAVLHPQGEFDRDRLHTLLTSMALASLGLGGS